MSKPKDDTAGQVRRAADSRPRPESGAPEADVSQKSAAKEHLEKGDKKPSSSWSPIDPGRPVRKS